MLKVGGGNIFGQLCSDSNSKSTNNYPVVSPPGDSNLDISKLLSYSVYCDHAVWVTQKGKVRGVGENSGGRIHGSLPKEKLNRWKEFQIIDKEGNLFDVNSAVCGLYYTLYHVQPRNGNGDGKLAYVYYNKNGGIPLFIANGEGTPVALFGGYKTSASINSDGSITIINKAVFDSPTASAIIARLPNDEKPVSIACCDRFAFVLSSSGHIYSSSLLSNGVQTTKFKEIHSTKGIKFAQISGTFDYCLAVSEDYRVFHCSAGSNRIESFNEIIELKDKQIKAAYAGYNHSLFQTNEGKLFACGNNDYGQLLFKTGPSNEDTVTPTETYISGGATFCIAGYQLSAIYLIKDPPLNSPNKKITNVMELSITSDSNFRNLPENNNDTDSPLSKCCFLM